MKKQILLFGSILLGIILLCALALLIGNPFKVTADSSQYPADFSFRFESWAESSHKNVLDSKKHLYHKASAENGTGDREYNPSETELRLIWAEAVNNDFFSIDQDNVYFGNTWNGSTISISDGVPYYYRITVEMNGESHTILGSTFTFAFDDQGSDTKHFCTFCKFLQEKFEHANV